MSRRNEKKENFTKQLVTAVTGFPDGEENFDLCMEFVSSNFKYHKFLDADSHKINRVIDGLCEKFEIHVQEEKAKNLKQLVQKFLEIPAFENRDYGKTSTHWAVLSLLLSLSESPTNAKFTLRQPTPKPEHADGFDWTKYLLEGEETFVQSHFDDQDLSDDDFLDEEPHSTVKFQMGIDLDRTELREGIDPSIHTHVTEPDISPDELWITGNVMVQYWKGESMCEGSDHPSATLNQCWDAHMTNTSELYMGESATEVTEYVVVRETLWLLGGAHNSFIYQFTEGHWKVNPKVKVSHLTQGVLAQTLGRFCVYGDILSQLQGFVDTVSGADMFCQVTGAQDDVVSQTYQAFGACLSRYATDFKHTLVRLERQAANQVEPATISSLLRNLTPLFAELDLISHILTKGVTACSHVTSNPGKASHLLAVIYDTMSACDTMGEYSVNQVHLLLPMWVETCKPYLSMIDGWVCEGVLNDPRREFIIQRNADVKCVDGTFWNTAFTLHTEQHKTPADNDNDTDEIQYAPTFLLPLLHPIILAGKSMEMLENLGKKAEFVEKGDQFYKRRTLYENFLSSMERLLGTTDSMETQSDNHTQDGRQISVFTENISQQMQVKEVRDPLLRLNFSQIVPREGKFTAQPLTQNTHNIHKRLEGLDLSGLAPVQLILEACLYPHLRERYRIVSEGLLRVMNTEFHLMRYLTAIRSFYLMEAGDTMYDFYTEIFEKLRHRESWQDVSYLTMLLQEALQEHYPHEIDRLTVEIVDKPSKDRTPVSALDGLRLNYQVPWPVNVVLDKSHMDKYNQVFSFLLQIKRAKYCLDELRFSDLEKVDIVPGHTPPSQPPDKGYTPPKKQTTTSALLHRMQIVRMKLLTFVNSLHNYIMTRILHSTGVEYQTQMDSAHDLDQLIRIHNKYLHSIHDRCLQHKDVRLIRDVVTKVLSLAIRFQRMWDEGKHALSDSAISDVDGEFSRCITFFTSVLTQAIKRGSFPHLETLAFALITFTDTKHS